MHKILMIGGAGLAGTLARYWLSVWIDTRWVTSFPIGTVIVNLTGCLLIGFLINATNDMDPVIRTAILTGFLGGFTTFSSFAVQTFNLVADGKMLLAATNLMISNTAGLLLVWAGYSLSRNI